MDLRILGPALALGIFAVVCAYPLSHVALPAWLLGQPVGSWGVLGAGGALMALFSVGLAGGSAAVLNPSRPRSAGAAAGFLATLPSLAVCGMPAVGLLGAGSLITAQTADPALMPTRLAATIAGVIGFPSLLALLGPALGAALGALLAAIVTPSGPRPPRALEPLGLTPIALLPFLAILGLTASLALDRLVVTVEAAAGSTAALTLMLLLVVQAAATSAAVAVAVRQAYFARVAGLRFEVWIRVIAIVGLLLVWCVGSLVLQGIGLSATVPIVAGVVGVFVGLLWASGEPTTVTARPRRIIDALARAPLAGVLLSYVVVLSVSPALVAALIVVEAIPWMSGEALRPDFAVSIGKVMALHRVLLPVVFTAGVLIYLVVGVPAWGLRRWRVGQELGPDELPPADPGTASSTPPDA